MRVAASISVAALCALALSSCANTLQDEPIPHNILESVIESPFPVYWLGGSFAGMAVTEATHDPGDAFTVAYGDCITGGQGECVRPLLLVSSPDNSFLPGGATATRALTIRGVHAVAANEGRAISLTTGPIVLDVYARTAQLALAAATAAAPINVPGASAGPLPPAMPNTGFGEQPLAFQIPTPPRPLR